MSICVSTTKTIIKHDKINLGILYVSVATLTNDLKQMNILKGLNKTVNTVTHRTLPNM